MLDFVMFAATAIIGLLIILYFVMRNSTETTNKPSTTKTIPRWNLPPADKKLGDFGELAKHGSLHQYLLHLHGNGDVPVTSFWWANTHVVSVCSPQAFKELVGLVQRPVLLFKGFEPLIGPDSIQYANGEEWEMRQKSLYHCFKGHDLQSYFSKFVTIAKETESSWTKYSESDKVPLGIVCFPLTIKGIARTCLGDVFEDNAEVEKLSRCYHTCWKEMEERIVSGDPEEGSERAKKFEASKGEMLEIIHSFIHSCKEGGSDVDIPSFIDSMLRNYTSEDKITSDVVSFLIGGFHTSGYLMTWMLWNLACHQDSQQRLLEEVQQKVGEDCGEKLKDYAYSPNTFMRQVQDETLRLSTVAPWAARFSDTDITVCGYNVPAGVPIITALGVALKNTTQWKGVDEWDPDRFSPTGEHGKRGNEFCPFGIHSKRKCPGYLFSYFEVATFIAILIQRYKFVPVEGQVVEPVYGLVTEPKEEIYVYLQQRN